MRRKVGSLGIVEICTKALGREKRYLYGVGDAGTRLLFKFTLGTQSFNKEQGRQKGKSECALCGTECKSVAIFMKELLGNIYTKF